MHMGEGVIMNSEKKEKHDALRSPTDMSSDMSFVGIHEVAILTGCLLCCLENVSEFYIVGNSSLLGPPLIKVRKAAPYFSALSKCGHIFL